MEENLSTILSKKHKVRKRNLNRATAVNRDRFTNRSLASPKSKLCFEIPTCNSHKSLGGEGGGLGKSVTKWWMPFESWASFRSVYKIHSADEITGCSASSLAIPTIKGWLDAKALSALPNPFSESNSYPKVPFSQYQCRWYRTSRVLLLASCSISGMPHTTEMFGYSFISTVVNLWTWSYYDITITRCSIVWYFYFKSRNWLKAIQLYRQTSGICQ